MQALLSVLRTIERRVDVVIPLFLENLAAEIVRPGVSPVDTGAYVTSHTFTTRTGSGRSRTSENKPSAPDPEVKRNEAYQQLLADVNSIPVDSPSIFFTNRSPHAAYVEGRYGVFDRVRSTMSTYLDDAVREASQIS